MPGLSDGPIPADAPPDMVETFVRTVAIVTSLLVLISFGLFAHEQLAGASQRQSDEVVGVDYSLPNPHREAQPRRFIDGAARALTRPFAFGDTSRSAWGQRGIPTLIALLIYVFG